MSTDAQSTNIGHLFASESAETPAQPQASEPAPLTEQPQQIAQPSPEQPPAPTPQAQPEQPREEQHRVPLAELINERRERQELAKHNRQLMETLQRLQQPPQPERQPIDPVTDPEGAFAALRQEFGQALLNERLNMSERNTRAAAGEETVNAAFEAAQQAGYVQSFINKADPYGEMVSWYRGQQLAKEIGSDPAAYRAKIEAEVIARLRAGTPTPPNLPPSLSNATKANATPEIVTGERDFFNSMMSNRRTQ